MACQHSLDDQTLQLQAGVGEDDFNHLPSGPDRVACEHQEEEDLLLLLLLLLHLCSPPISLGCTIWGEIFAYVTIFSSNR